MHAQDLLGLLRARPFEPFRLVGTDGQVREVRHPDEALVLRTRVVLPVPAAGGVAEAVEHLDLADVLRAEPIDAPAGPPADAVGRFRDRLRAELPALAGRFHVETLELFGSYTRGEQRPGSDLDVLVTFTDTPSLFRLVEMEDHLSDLLGVKVDLVMRDSLRPEIAATVLPVAVPV